MKLIDAMDLSLVKNAMMLVTVMMECVTVINIFQGKVAELVVNYFDFYDIFTSKLKLDPIESPAIVVNESSLSLKSYGLKDLGYYSWSN